MTCIHSTTGLCPACQADYDEDPAAWLEFGEHPDGIRRWEELRAEMDWHEGVFGGSAEAEQADAHHAPGLGGES